ncbi:UDP-glucose 4-epimerase GalE [Deferribacterales bacterium RsTz2092]|nr:UDP-glucose 4-epimerase [Deferribacterales bacterium]
MNVLVTGGLGYIGSHAVLCLLKSGFDVTIADNLSNCDISVHKRLEELSDKPIKLYTTDVRASLSKIFEEDKIDAVIHFAALKAVGESIQKPLEYYDNNVYGAINLLETMSHYGVKSFVFSSSAVVYGDSGLPYREDAPVSAATNPYGQTKIMIENILQDLYRADNSWHIAILRYFNPIGAHESGKIGENPVGIPNNLMPYVAKVASGELKELSVFGGDYSTPDGTGIRDYIHVCDLAEGHIAALNYIANKTGAHTWNLGTGKGYSVLEIVNTFINITGVQLPYKVVARRAGDVPVSYCDPSKAQHELGWQATRTLTDMVKDTWHWERARTADERL